jgi:hypothetical protein
MLQFLLRCVLAFWPHVFFLMTAGGVTSAGGRPQSSQNNSTTAAVWLDLPPDDGSVKLSRIESACLASGRILWPADRQCYSLLDQGPCERGQWLVLDASGTRVDCQPRRCPCDAAHRDLCEVEVEHLAGSCHVAATAAAAGLCAPGEQLVVTPRGYGVCGCITRPPHVLWNAVGDEEGNNGRCYPLYQQGPCQPGFQLHYSRSRNEPVCQPALCADGSVLWPADGVCYPLEQAGGPCPDDLHRLVLDPASLEPVCQLDESRVKRVFDIIPTGVVTDAPLSPELITKDCQLDARGRCVRGPRRRGGAGTARGYVNWLKSYRSWPTDGVV